MNTQATTGPATPILSEEIIPAIAGRFYGYSTELTATRPLFCLMDCKANKGRALMQAEELGPEIDLVFLFQSGVSACSPNSVLAGETIELVSMSNLNETKVVNLGSSDDIIRAFTEYRGNKHGRMLASFCRGAIAACHDEVVEIRIGNIVAVVTKSGKHGLFQVMGLTPTSVQIDACHVLLP